MTRDEISLIFQVETLSQSPASQEFQKQLSSELWQPLAQGQLTDINISAWQSKEKFPHPAVYFLYNPFLLRDCGSDLSYLLPPPTTYHQPHSSYFTLQEPLWSRRSLSWVVVCVCLSPPYTSVHILARVRFCVNSVLTAGPVKPRRKKSYILLVIRQPRLPYLHFTRSFLQTRAIMGQMRGGRLTWSSSQRLGLVFVDSAKWIEQ